MIRRLLARFRHQPTPESEPATPLGEWVVADSIEGIERALADGFDVMAAPELVRRYFALRRYAGSSVN